MILEKSILKLKKYCSKMTTMVSYRFNQISIVFHIPMPDFPPIMENIHHLFSRFSFFAYETKVNFLFFCFAIWTELWNHVNAEAKITMNFHRQQGTGRIFTVETEQVIQLGNCQKNNCNFCNGAQFWRRISRNY